MAQSEPRKLAIRSLLQRPAESVLLIIGIALGIGTTAGGIAMVSNLVNEGKELEESTAYREIVVSTRESATDMDVAAYRNESEESVVLTGADLEARDSAPDIQYAYTANLRRIRIANFEELQFGRGQSGTIVLRGEGTSGTVTGTTQGAPASDSESSAQGAPKTENTSAPITGTRGSDAPQGGDADTSQSGRQTQPNNRTTDEGNTEGGTPRFQIPENFRFEIPEYEGPAPVIEEIRVIEMTPELFPAYEIQPAQGSLFTQQEIDAGRPVAVVGANLANILYEDGVALGRSILLNRQLYEIIGVAEPTGTQYDDFAFYPAYVEANSSGIAATIARFRGFGAVLRFTVFDADRLDEAKAQLQNYFGVRYGTGAVVVRTPGTEARETLDRNARLVTIILFLAVAGLLIAAVNVSNILYSRAMRRRKSIGILKALGATRQAVFKLFLAEALTIGTFGALLGVGISIGFTRLLGDAYAATSLITLPMIGGALGALILTLALTIIPALQISAIPAAVALRYE